jgi:hypothetical protein
MNWLHLTLPPAVESGYPLLIRRVYTSVTATNYPLRLRNLILIFEFMMSTIKVNVSLYGTLARLAGGQHVGQVTLELENGASKADVLDHLGIPPQERGYLFINAVLCDVPGLNTEGQELLQDGDHIGIFSIDRVWPYQYRDGVKMSEALKAALQVHGAMHHNYGSRPEEAEPHR